MKSFYSNSLTALALIITCACGLQAQTVTAIEDESAYQGELNRMTNLPETPEAAAFMKYGDNKVSLYTGTPQVSVPLYVFKGREMDLPFQLSYDGSGIKVEQKAGNVGLSWSLQPGGRITRQVNGLPDDYTSGSYNTLFTDLWVRDTMAYHLALPGIYGDPRFASVDDAKDYVKFLLNVNLNKIDLQPDVFKVNAGGLNDTFVIDYDANPIVAKSLSNPRLKIEMGGTNYTSQIPTPYISKWKVTDEDGTEYYFEAEELTYRQNSDVDRGTDLMGDAHTYYVSSWALTKIISPNHKDTYEIAYDTVANYLAAEQFATAAQSVITRIESGVTNYPAPTTNSITGAVFSYNKPLYITQIKYNNDVIANYNYADRYDFANAIYAQRLESVDILDPFSSNTIQTLYFENEDYFSKGSKTLAQLAADVATDYFKIRLKLNGVRIEDPQSTDYKEYTFEYHNPDALPSRDSKAQDIYGYYNGANNQTIFPKIEYSGLTFNGGNRDSDSNSSRVGLLTKITYPTGGYSVFEYESHQIYELVESTPTLIPLGITINDNIAYDPDLYRDDEGFICDDEFLAFDPKIVIQSFVVTETGDYKVNLSGPTNQLDAWIVDTDSTPEDYSNYCEFYGDTNALWQSNASGNTISLQTGKTYKALLLLDKDQISGTYGSATLTVTKDIVTYNYTNVNVGGNRIEAITDYSAAGKFAKKKEYDYGTFESTGVLNYKPNLFDIRQRETDTTWITDLVRYAAFGTGDEPHVVYKSVTETQRDSAGLALGATEYHFFTGPKGSTPMTLAPFENNFFPNLRPGEVQERKVNEGGTTIERDSTDFYETVDRPISVTSLIVYNDEDRSDKVVFFKEEFDANDNFLYATIHYRQAYLCDAPPTNDHPGFCILPGEFANPTAYGYHSYFNDQKYAPNRLRKGFINGAYGGVNYQKREFTYENQSNSSLDNTLTIVETTQYDTIPGSYYLPKSKTTFDSRGRELRTDFHYPHENLVSGDNHLVTQNNLVAVTKTENYQKISGSMVKMSEMSRNYTQAGSGVLPSEMQYAKGSNSLESVYWLEYYTSGNLKSSAKPIYAPPSGTPTISEYGPTTYYIWGYDDRYPIAKIENFDASDASLVQTSINAAIASSDADMDNCNTSGCDELALRNALQTLRDNLPAQALMTSYTYDPQVGVTSITDTRGYTTFVEYDGLKRLTELRDEENNLLSDYIYHYKGQN